MTKLLIIAGATASGKSTVAVELAKEFDGEIISCDSMQIYKGLNIGTAKMSDSEQLGIPHHLIDVADINSSFSVAEYQKQSTTIINDITQRNMLPIVVGGTGLYIDSIIYPFGLGESLSDPNIRLQLEHKYEIDNGISMHAQLAGIDPVDAAKIHPNNKIRLIRAMEIFTLTGKTKSELSIDNNKISYDILMLIPNVNRETLYSRINERVDTMFEQGLIEEVQTIINLYPNAFNYQSMQAIGYKEFKDYFNGNINLDQLKELIKKNSRNYAKRQITWFKNKYPFAIWDEPSNFPNIIKSKFFKYSTKLRN